MRNIEAPKALSQFRAWGIAPGDQIAVDQSAETVSIQRVVFNPQPTRGGGESRFQRCTSIFTHASWGAARGWALTGAPLALITDPRPAFQHNLSVSPAWDTVPSLS